MFQSDGLGFDDTIVFSSIHLQMILLFFPPLINALDRVLSENFWYGFPNFFLVSHSI